MKLEINVPVQVEVRDYHQFDDIKDNIKLLSKQLKVKELGCNGNYIGIIYVGRLTDPVNAEMVRSIKEELRD